VDRALNALSVAEEHALVPHVAHAHFALGSLGSEPAAHLRAAFDIYRALGGETLRRRVAHAMKSAGVEAPRRRRVAKGALTDTELKLSRLRHDGVPNREISNVLMLSPKTVEVYLSRLFAKTGC